MATVMESEGMCPSALVARYRLDRTGPMGQVDCHVCLDEPVRIGIVGARCYSEAREIAAMDETDGLYASIEGIAEALYRMEMVTRESVRHLPGEEDPIPWAVRELPAKRRASVWTTEWGAYAGQVGAA